MSGEGSPSGHSLPLRDCSQCSGGILRSGSLVHFQELLLSGNWPFKNNKKKPTVFYDVFSRHGISFEMLSTASKKVH